MNSISAFMQIHYFWCTQAFKKSSAQANSLIRHEKAQIASAFKKEFTQPGVVKWPK